MGKEIDLLRALPKTKRNIEKGKAMGAAMAPQPTAVSTLEVKPQSWQPVLSAVGTIRSVNGTTLSTDLAGIVSKIGFESGAQVTTRTATVTINDNDNVSALAVSDVSVTEPGSGGSINAVFAVTLGPASERTVTVPYSVVAGSATAERGAHRRHRSTRP